MILDKENDIRNTFCGSDVLKDIRVAPEPYYAFGEAIGLPFNLSDLIRVHGKEFIPEELGIYHLFYEERLIYIGMSKNIRGRLLSHLKDKDMPFNNVLWFCASTIGENLTVEDILRLEYKMIKLYKPPLNTVHASCK